MALFFFLYCFLGWVWESCYVSAKRRQWVNRGFLHGPMLPIYGTGAVIILLATIPVRDSLWLVFLLGMLAATALEYVTGAAMEALFKVRYWDYSKQPFNLNGYICLTSSLAWGAFSILLVRFLHPACGGSGAAAARLPGGSSGVPADHRRHRRRSPVLPGRHGPAGGPHHLTEENEDLRRLAKRVEVISAFAEEDLRRFPGAHGGGAAAPAGALGGHPPPDSGGLCQGRPTPPGPAGGVPAPPDRCQADGPCQHPGGSGGLPGPAGSARDLTEESLEARRAEVQQLLDRLRDREASIRARTARRYRQSLRILRGNPSASAKAFAEALESLRKLGDRREGEDGE